MTEITRALVRARSGDPARLGEVYDLVYPELKRLARSRARHQPPGSTLTTTAIVHESYVRLANARELSLTDRRHFFACAARAMRMIVVDHVRSANAAKRGGAARPVTLPSKLADEGTPPDLLDLDRALRELGQIDERLRSLVELKYFLGSTHEEIADLWECSTRTIQRDWRRARALLHARLSP